MIRIYIIMALCLFSSSTVLGQSNVDSIKTHQLDDVVVKAGLRVQRGDTLSVIPSATQRKFNVNGYELLRSMMLPGLKVNTLDGSLSMTGGERALVLIDGRPVERQDILSLSPKRIARVEYIQNPGPEYSYDTSLGVVINKLQISVDFTAAGNRRKLTRFVGETSVIQKSTVPVQHIGLSLTWKFSGGKKVDVDVIEGIQEYKATEDFR